MKDSTVAAIEAEITGAKYAGEAAQQEFDARVVEYAMAHGINPVHAVRGPIFVIGQAGLDECKKGLDL